MYKISLELAELLKGKVCFKDNLFNPIQDINGDWFISKEEVDKCTNTKYKQYLKLLTQSEFIAKVQ